jgi:hypothetical protein
MRYALILAALLAVATPPAISGDLLTTSGADSVRLTQEPCPVSVLQVLPQGSRGHYRKALVVFEGKDYIACHATLGTGMVHVVYDDGDQGLIPVGMFKEEPDA